VIVSVERRLAFWACSCWCRWRRVPTTRRSFKFKGLIVTLIPESQS
jgi:hypothetical protein